MTAVVGTPMDVTIEELAIESFYPADERPPRLCGLTDTGHDLRRPAIGRRARHRRHGSGHPRPGARRGPDAGHAGQRWRGAVRRPGPRPAVGGLLISAFGWRSVFLVNLPIGLLALAGVRAAGEPWPRW